MLRTGLVVASLLLILSFGCQPASADSGVTYSVSGVYSPDTTYSQLSGGSDTFTMSFTLPSQPVTTDFVLGDDFFVEAPVSFTFSTSNGTASGLVLVNFYSPNSISQPGGFFVDFCPDGPTCPSGLEYQWQVPGPLLYSGLESFPTLLPTSFDFTGGQFMEQSVFSDTVEAGTFDGSVSASVVTTPEPASAALLALGIFGIFAISLYQKRQSTLVRS